LALVLLAAGMLPAMAENTNETGPADQAGSGMPDELTFQGKYLQEEARSLLKYINDFRTSADAWEWNEDSSEKILHMDLKPLTYDYGLEKAAMIRAKELAVRFAHTRPDGSDPRTAYEKYDISMSYGENIAEGHRSALEVFTAWSEEDEDYSGQGHRRNMLSGSYTAVGISCVEYSGRKYWVEVFSSQILDTEPVSYSEDNQEMTVRVDPQLLKFALSIDIGSRHYIRYIMYGETGQELSVPDYAAYLIYDASTLFPVTAEMSDLTVSDESLAEINGGSILLKAEGECILSRKAVYRGFESTASLVIRIRPHTHRMYMKEWQWSDDSTKAYLVMKCGDDDYEELIEAVMTSETVSPTCHNVGKTIYYASAEYEGKTYTDKREVVTAPKLPHTWAEPVYTWQEDPPAVYARTECEVCHAELKRYAYPIWSVIKEPTYTETGIGQYTAEFTEPFTTQIRTVIIPVKEVPSPASVSVYPETASLTEGGRTRLYAEVSPKAADQTVIWSSDSPEVVTVDENGNISAVSEGTARVTATSAINSALSDSCTVTVNPVYPHPVSVKINYMPEQIWVGSSFTVSASVAPANAKRDVVWTSSDPDIVSISDQGVMKGLREGTAVITVACAGNPAITDSAAITVKNPDSQPPSAVTLNRTSASLCVAESLTLKATVKPANASDSSVTWTSSDSSVAAVDQSGTVRGKKTGTAVITVRTVNGKTASCRIRILFRDVPEAGYYYCDPVYWAVEKGITNGYIDTDGYARTFKPQNNCTREAVVTFLWRLVGKPEPRSMTSRFSDVKDKSKYYYKAVLWAAEKGITGGYNDGTFKPSATCLREHVVTFLWRYAGKPEVPTANSFTDISTKDYYYKAVLWAAKNNITKGYADDNYKTFRPRLDCLREHVVTFLYRHAK
jgi:uncharacterized protein YjdB/uncharacterized protein YkwD